MYKVYSLLPMFTRLQYNLHKVSQHNILQYSTRLQYNTMQNKVLQFCITIIIILIMSIIIKHL